MKKKILIFSIVIFLTFGFFVYVSAEEKEPPDPYHKYQSTAEEIVHVGYALIDEYIKELPGPTSVFPNGYFTFFLANDVRVDITPGLIYGKMWRTIGFAYPDNSIQAVVLDGPVYGEPGTPNQTALLSARDTLARELSSSQMAIKRIFRNDVNLNLAEEEDMRTFLNTMKESIKVKFDPFRLTTPEIVAAKLPKGTVITIKPADDKPLTIKGALSSFSEIKTKIDFNQREKDVKINLDKDNKQSIIQIDNSSVDTDKNIEIKNSKLYIETSAGQKEIKVFPSEALSNIPAGMNVKRTNLKEASNQAIYSISSEKPVKLFWVIPMTLKTETKISAETNKILSMHKPWWKFLAK